MQIPTFLKVSPRTRITVALVGVVSSVLVASKPLKIFPDRERAAMQGREYLAETIALSGSALLAVSDDSIAMTHVLEGIATRNTEIKTIGLRTVEGDLALEIPKAGDHQNAWSLEEGSPSNDQFMFVPLLSICCGLLVSRYMIKPHPKITLRILKDSGRNSRLRNSRLKM